ncbi:hypothetical protein Prudu_021990, partial [Prunus dulcis]
RPFDFQAAARPPQAEPISAVGTYGSASVSPSQPDQYPPGAALSRPEIVFSDGGSFEATRTSSSKFSFVSHQIDRRFIDLLFMDNQASEVQPISRRNLQRAKLARTICRKVHRIHHRATLSLRASKSGHSQLLVDALLHLHDRSPQKSAKSIHFQSFVQYLIDYAPSLERIKVDS